MWKRRIDANRGNYVMLHSCITRLNMHVPHGSRVGDDPTGAVSSRGAAQGTTGGPDDLSLSSLQARLAALNASHFSIHSHAAAMTTAAGRPRVGAEAAEEGPHEDGILQTGGSAAQSASTTGPLLAGLKRFGFKSKALRVSKAPVGGEGADDGGGGGRAGGLPGDVDGPSDVPPGSMRDDGATTAAVEEANLGALALGRKRRAPGGASDGGAGGAWALPPPAPAPAPPPVAFPSSSTGLAGPGEMVKATGVPLCSPPAEPRAKRRVRSESVTDVVVGDVRRVPPATVAAAGVGTSSTAGPFDPSDGPSLEPASSARGQPSDAAAAAVDHRGAFRHGERFVNENERPPSPPRPWATQSARPASANVAAILSPIKPGRERSPEVAAKSSSSPLVTAAAPRPALAPRNVPPPPMFDGRPSIASLAAQTAPPAVTAVPAPTSCPAAATPAPTSAPSPAATTASRGPPPERLAEPQRQSMEDQQWVYVHGIRCEQVWDQVWTRKGLVWELWLCGLRE